jgi:hypothetical protein
MAAHSPIALPAVGILGKLKGAATLAKQVYDEGATQAANAQLAAQPLQAPPAATSPASGRRRRRRPGSRTPPNGTA